MKDNKEKRSSHMTIKRAAQSLGIKTAVLQYHIDAGKIEAIDGMVNLSVCEILARQQKNYIGIRTFLKGHDNDRFKSIHINNRNKYIDFLEDNDYFGIETVDPENIFFELPSREDFYVSKEDAQLLEYKSEKFFDEFGLSEKEKVNKIIIYSKDHPTSEKYIREYLAFIEDKEDIYTPSITAFVRIIFDLPDIKLVTDEDIISAIEETDIVNTKNVLIDFLKYVAKFETVKYHGIELKKKESISEPAYPYEDFVKLAKILFNSDYDKEHNLTLRAFENSKYIEMWMFLSCHFVCGWRASDICDRWIYPSLKSNDNPFDIDLNKLKDGILNESIADEIYDKVALYSIKRIEMAYNVPQKTGIGKLRSEIVPELRAFFGKLILIAEYHHFTSGEGYMKSHRISSYRSWVLCKEFFGDDIYSITGKHSFSSRRLNKSYLQGLEQAAKDNGNTTLVAHMIASFARNHSNIETTTIYLKDHGLTGESAELVLYMMMQRGVFSVSLYNALIAAYPRTFEKMSAKEQTAIMEKISISAFDLETLGISATASEQIVDFFSKGKKEETADILKAMFVISQGNGKAKDTGIYCKKKALGFCCEYPTYESCIANLCPHHVFTSDGVPALIKVIKDYQFKSIATGNRKYEIALKSKIIPAFQDIINKFMKDMNSDEKLGIKKLIMETVNE